MSADPRRVASPSGTGGTEKPRFHGEAKLVALAACVWKKGEVDDLEARSILGYIAKLEKEAARAR